MAGRQRILPVRREYNRWVANQTLEDYALRFTAKSARRWSTPRVAQTAIGAISFLALEAIGGSITLSYGVTNTIAATIVAGILLFLTGMPVARYASRYGVDIDLLTRGAGFGYIGSTVTSLIYATFTFILFAIEASIMSTALEVCFGIPLPVGYVISAVAVIPLVTHGMTRISRFQILTQPLWIGLNILPVGFIAWQNWGSFEVWRNFPGLGSTDPGFDLLEVRRRRFRHPGADAADRRAGRRAALHPGGGHRQARVDRDDAGRPRLGGARRAQAALRLVPGGPGAQPRGAGGARRRARPDVPGRLRLRHSLAGFPAVAHRRLRGGLAAQDQRHERLCRVAGLVELLFPPHPQPSRPGRMADLQRVDRAGADGARHLHGTGEDPRPVLHRRRRLAGLDRRRPHHQQAPRPVAAGHRVQARPSLRHQSGRRRRHGDFGGAGAHLRHRPFRRNGAGAGRLHRACRALHRRAGDRLGHRRQILPGAQAAGALAAARRHPLHRLRSRIRARGYGLLPGLFGADLFAVLLARCALQRSVQAEGTAARAGGSRRGGAAAGVADEPHQPAHRAVCRPAHRVHGADQHRPAARLFPGDHGGARLCRYGGALAMGGLLHPHDHCRHPRLVPGAGA